MTIKSYENNSSIQQIRQIRRYSESYLDKITDTKISSGIKKDVDGKDIRKYDLNRSDYKDSLSVNTLSSLRKLESQLGNDIKILADIYNVAQKLNNNSSLFLNDINNKNTIQPETRVVAGEQDGYSGITLRKIRGKVYIDQIDTGSPAEKSGFIVGDRVRFVNGVQITDDTSFQQIIDQNAGNNIDIEIIRKLKKYNFNLNIEDRTQYTTETIEFISPSEEVLSFKEQARILYNEMKEKLSNVEIYGESFIDKRINSENLWTNKEYQYREIVFGFSNGINTMSKLSIVAENQQIGTYMSNIHDSLTSIDSRGKLTTEAQNIISQSVTNILNSKEYLEVLSGQIKEKISIGEEFKTSRNKDFDKNIDPYNDEIENELARQRAYEISAGLMRASLTDIQNSYNAPSLSILSGGISDTEKPNTRTDIVIF